MKEKSGLRCWCEAHQERLRKTVSDGVRLLGMGTVALSLCRRLGFAWADVFSLVCIAIGGCFLIAAGVLRLTGLLTRARPMGEGEKALWGLMVGLFLLGMVLILAPYS
ncbi:hypothetical protein LI291_11475 [Intestinibacillus massiliensis]|nr:hypothetical protein [Intestinibacillus massiliensis]